MKKSLLVGALLVAPLAHTAPNIELQKKNSFLAISAFECAVVSPNDIESERLFKLGYTTGKDFLHFVQTDTNLYQKTLKSQVPMLWNLMGGPTPDFILGLVYADRQHEIYKEFSPDNEIWKSKKQKIYQARNCALLSKP